MLTIPKQLFADEVLKRLNAIHKFSEVHPEEWRNQVARDMNHLLGRATWWMETDRDEIDTKFGAAVLRIVERVAESENIESSNSLKKETAKSWIEVSEAYNELIMAVASKHGGESRHQTALRYIRERENVVCGPACEKIEAKGELNE